jgi:hypothetical protein
MTLSARSEVGPGRAAKAKRQAWQRPVLGALIVALLAGVAVGLVYALRSTKPPGPPQPPGASSQATSQTERRYASPLGWSIRFPRGIHSEHSAAGGISFAVNETTFANFRLGHGVQRRTTPRSETIREVPPRTRLGKFPAAGVAVRVLWLQTLHRTPPGATRLPLRLSSFRVGGLLRDWYPGTQPRPLQHVLRSKGQSYFVQAWIGPKASAHQRALLAHMIASLSVRHVRS